MLLGIPEKKTKIKRSFRESVQFSKGTILDSGSYRHKFTITERKSIDAGTYVLIASTYHAGQCGECILTIDSSVDVLAEPIT